MSVIMSVDALAYEAINKCFRNAIVGLIRTKLSDALGEHWETKLASMFNDWDGVARSAVSAATNGVVERQARDNADLLSVNHFYNIFERYFLELVEEALRPDGDALKPFKNSLLASFREIKSVRDPISHPPEQDLSPFDALNVVYNASKILRLLQLTEAMERLEEVRQELAQRAAADSHAPQATSAVTACSLPPREEMYDQFVGRSAELEHLWQWLADPSAGRWVLVGEGGKGKSTIAYQFCNTVRLTGAGDLAGVFWLSAKRRRYFESTVVDVESPDFCDLNSALDKILRDYGWSSDVHKSVDAKRAQVLDLLRSLPCLLAVDDLDSIESEYEDVVEFFTYDAPRTGSKILITSRRQYVGMSRCSTKVSGLPRDDASQFLSVTAERLGLSGNGALLSRHEKIIEITEGSPLYMEDLLRLCRMHAVDKAIDRWRQEAGDAARRYALQRERELLTKVAADVLDACCLAGVGLTVAQLERILNQPESEVIGALGELEKAFLVPSAVLIDDVPTFRVNRNLESMARRDLRQDPGRLPLRNAVDAVVGNRRGRADDKAEDLKRQVRVLITARRLPEAVSTGERALSEYPNHPEILGTLALAYARSSPPQVADARRAWARAGQLLCSSQDIYVEWTRFEEDQQDWGRMAAAAQIGVANCGVDKFALLQIAGYAQSRVGQAQARALDTSSAQQSLERAKELLKQALHAARRWGAPDQVVSKTYRGLVLNAQAMRDGKDIAYWLEQWLDWKPNDPHAIQECERQAQHYVQLRGLLPSASGAGAAESVGS